MVDNGVKHLLCAAILAGMMGLFDGLLGNLGEAKARAQAHEAAAIFDRYQQWFDKLPPCNDTFEVQVGGVRYRGYCNNEDKTRAWDADWRSKNPHWGPPSAGISVSSEPREIWFDLRKIGDYLTANPGVVGHETMHMLNNADKRFVDPDRLIDPKIYMGASK